MERKIGEIFEFEGEWYQCVEHANCCGCGFVGQGECYKGIRKYIGVCRSDERDDSKSVIFKKLEKVGKPLKINRKIYQGLISPYGFNNCSMCALRNISCKDLVSCYDDYIFIEIKQNKEDMEEENIIRVKQTPLQKLINRYNNGLRYEDFEEEVKKLYTNNPTEENKLRPKPFNLEAAKAGKPVCTRDGRKARIICFDQEDIRPIIALIKLDKGGESAYYYYTNGMNLSDNYQSVYDLMMLPEKKEGWVNVYMEETNNNERLAEQVIYKTRKDAFDNACPRGYKATVKIEWEE